MVLEGLWGYMRLHEGVWMFARVVADGLVCMEMFDDLTSVFYWDLGYMTVHKGTWGCLQNDGSIV